MDLYEPDFLVLPFSVWIFHHDIIKKLIEVNITILESRHSVHIKKVPV